ncbi:MAG TPA: hypothetical protein VFV05_22925 [Methylomirabilota bacterium]|nr:hypothetical protein [Methylomirabilota bacterium]
MHGSAHDGARLLRALADALDRDAGLAGEGLGTFTAKPLPDRNLSVVAVILLALLGLSTACTRPGEAGSDLDFFMATRDVNVYQSEPGGFERVVQPPERGGDLYIKKAAALSVPVTKVRHVTVEKKAVEDIQTILRDPSGSSREGQPREAKQYSYAVIFELYEEAAHAFRSFAAAHEAQLVEMRIGKRRLAVVRLMGPFMSEKVTVPLVETDQDRIRELLAEMKAKTTWR